MSLAMNFTVFIEVANRNCLEDFGLWIRYFQMDSDFRLSDIEMSGYVGGMRMREGVGGGLDNPGFDDSYLQEIDVEKRHDDGRTGKSEMILPKPEETIRIYQFEEPSNR